GRALHVIGPAAMAVGRSGGSIGDAGAADVSTLWLWPHRDHRAVGARISRNDAGPRAAARNTGLIAPEPTRTVSNLLGKTRWGVGFRQPARVDEFAGSHGLLRDGRSVT